MSQDLGLQAFLYTNQPTVVGNIPSSSLVNNRAQFCQDDLCLCSYSCICSAWSMGQDELIRSDVATRRGITL